uniref:Uncharacterized protein n=1 Tax=Homalodisca liturata TaxID=320908 RepID=A0A1B6IVQ2_9HEMI
MDQLDCAVDIPEVEDTEHVPVNMDPAEDNGEITVSNSGEESATTDETDCPGEDESHPTDQDNSDTSESIEEPCRSERRKRHILDAPLFDCPEGQARDFLGNCRPVF